MKRKKKKYSKRRSTLDRHRDIAVLCRSRPAAEVARMYGVSLGTVSIACKTHGVTLIPSVVPSARVRSFEVLGELVNTADKYEDIAGRFNCSRQYIGKVAMAAKNNNIPLHIRRK